MKILYDISVLGKGYKHYGARTGVFRVVENLAYGLSLSKECELFFCSGNLFKELSDCLDYINSEDSKKKFKNISLVSSKLTILKKFTSQKLISLNRQINNYGKKDDSMIIYLKLLRRFVNYSNRLANIFHDTLIPENILNKTDIFHSTFYHIPEQVRQLKHKTVFLTVYDLIPLLYPNLFSEYREYEENRIKQTLESLTPENWVICISNAVKNDLCNYRKDIDPYKVFVTHLAASDLFYPCHDVEKRQLLLNKYHIPDTPYFLGLSTLEPRKNFRFAIKCFLRLLQEEHIKDLYMVLVGNKYPDNILEEIYNNTLLKNRVIYAGYVADEDLAAVYSGAIAFVYPSICEGFGLPPLEAMKCSIPVITSNTSSLPEVIGDAGIMVSPTDEDALCQAMLELYRNSSLRKAMSLKSIERAKQFSWEKCASETINAYKTALNSDFKANNMLVKK